MKVKRIKVREMVSAGVGSVLPQNPVRPDVEMKLHDSGILIYSLRTKETILVPWDNLVEVVVEEQKTGRPKKSNKIEN